MKRFALVGAFIGTFAVGVIAGAWWSGRVLGKMTFAKPEIDQAFLAAQEAEWVSQLRLDEVQSAIADLENSIHARLAAIATWEAVAPAYEQTRTARDRFLRSVKTYSESHPLAGGDERINALLATVPGRNPTSTCNSAVCRLDDLRVKKLKSTTNSP